MPSDATVVTISTSRPRLARHAPASDTTQLRCGSSLRLAPAPALRAASAGPVLLARTHTRINGGTEEMAADIDRDATRKIGLLWRGNRAEDPYANPRTVCALSRSWPRSGG